MPTLIVYPDKLTPQYILTSNAGADIEVEVEQKLIPVPVITEKVLKKDADKFTTVLAHEIRNPLTNINLSVEVLERGMADDRLKIYFDIIRRSSLRINDLLNEVLQHQPADKVKVETYSIHEVLAEVLEMTRDSIALKDISIINEYSEQSCLVTMNRPKMKIALTNIIINAIDAMTFHKGVLKMVTTAGNDFFTLCIEDNGCGISKDNLKKIFDPYFTNKPGGIGLGLSATYEILITNFIGVTVKSVEGEGTSFILLFNKKPETLSFAL